MNTKKMNFEIFLVIVWFFGKFERVFAAIKLEPPFEAKSDTPELLKFVKEAYENLSTQVSYRFDLEEKARVEAETQKDIYEKQTQAGTFSETQPPPEDEDRTTKKLWNNAKNAVDKYNTVKAEFANEKFCQPNSPARVCERAFKNAYFKDLTYDDSQQNECEKIDFPVQKEDGTVENMTVEFRLCWAKSDRTNSLFRVYLQSAYKQPLIGHTKFFAVSTYFYSEYSEAWVPTSSKHITEGLKYRYEAYLSLSWF